MQDLITSEYPDHVCIHNFFEEQVARGPGSTALIFAGQVLS